MARVTVYKHSILASLLNIFASLIIMGGVAAVFGGEILGGIFLFAVGMGMYMLGTIIGERTKYRTLIRYIRKSGAEAQLKNDMNALIQVYNACPGNGMLRYIQSINPQAAQMIRERLTEQKKAI